MRTTDGHDRSIGPRREDQRPGSDFEHREQVSRRQAAERLVDIAYALAGGDAFELRAGGSRVKVPVTDAVVLKFASRSDGERVEVEIVLKWAA